MRSTSRASLKIVLLRVIIPNKRQRTGMPMTFEQVELYIAACNAGSIAAAARQLFISRQAASFSLRKLENELGMQLLLRTPEGVIPSEYGAFVYDQFKIIVETRSAIRNAVSLFDCHRKEHLNIGLAYGALSSLGPQTFDSFRKANPLISFSLHDNADRDVEDLVASGAYDVGFGIEPIDRASFSVIPLWNEEIYLQAYAGHELFGVTNVTAEKLSHQSFVNAGPRQKYHESFPDHCEKMGFLPNILETGGCCEYAALADIAARNSALFSAPAHMINPAKMHVWSIPMPLPMYWSVSLITNIGQASMPAVQKLISFMEDWVSIYK